MLTELSNRLQDTGARAIVSGTVRSWASEMNLGYGVIATPHDGERRLLSNKCDLSVAPVLSPKGTRVLWKRKGQECKTLLMILLLGLCTCWVCTMNTQAETSVASLAGAGDTGITQQAKHGLSQKAEEVVRLFSFPITNSMIVTWLVALSLIAFARVATRRMKQVPDGAQNFLEWVVEQLYTFLEELLGQHLVRRTFWFFATVFIFILCANWFGLIPGVGTIGWGQQTTHGFKISQPLLRGANADVNQTLAMALVFFACWIIWAIQEVGLLGFLKELFAPKGESTGLLQLLLAVVFFAAGCLEIISILFRPVSLGFRLYGNIFAGENMLETMANLVPGMGWLLPVPFYFLELLVGLVQALVFMLLTAVFTLLICQHETAGVEPAHD
jgi:F-type H+-transporting ATPase subunit a